ncbi:SpvB/TcaC N-terminal domain-containing protein [Pedobacter cryoconitis]|uniref:SpvB/TcaC N-terminal domain-containing protein n=1 Tax=Pedobacter cryoconitis TaxID=188932 RepID=UPI00160813EB|nr:SpvB/TcaC N-terminal domain-containing protein [Pedobacter cryoconitis]MBB5644963.1 RHS repeat-associated protein [Pedobacter cryoconitis]
MKHDEFESKNKSDKQFLNTEGGKTKSNAIEIPSINLPKGGGAIKGIDEKFSVNALNGTASFSVPLPFSSARGNSPALNLTYSSGAGNGVFGLGWTINLPAIKRRTDKKLPRYDDLADSDVFLFSDAEDLVPVFKKDLTGDFMKDPAGQYIIDEKDSADHLFTVRYYRPRIEGLFARIERWTAKTGPEIHWRVTTKTNVTTLFGWSVNSRIADPGDENKISEWLPEFVFDDKGNCIRYSYKKEDELGFDPQLIQHTNRLKAGKITYTNLYLEKVLYGNKTPYIAFGDAYPAETDFIFQTVFDYGEYDTNAPYQVIQDWDFRADAFSAYKTGFEIRTTRLCKRVLLFHYFEELTDTISGQRTLVKSLNFDYNTSTAQGFTFLNAITAFGYIKQTDGTYTSQYLPAMEFTYQEHEWNKEIKILSPEALVHAPSGLDEQQYQFTDLFNEGLSGILTEQGNGWHYKRNLGDGNFENARLVAPKPSFSGLNNQLQITDLDADGGRQVVSYNNQPRGYFELSEEDEWQPFRYFQTLPNIDMKDPNARMLDLNGDGRPDVLITEEQVFTWYESSGREGFSCIHKVFKPFDEESGPHILFAEAEQTIFLADMQGDGLTDLVRIRNGEVCYWPNLGYGKFGAKITMGNAPFFDYPDAFNPALIKLTDIDGSGTTDLIYLGQQSFRCWLNLNGNSFSTTPVTIDPFPEISNLAKVTAIDLLGNGVACIVWSSSLAKDAEAPLKYIDLMNSKKPNILTSYKNNLGKEVTLEYTPSTKFYLEDKLAGRPWVTKLHFPVHCLSRTETRDQISGFLQISTYDYHHGYFDHAEKEFRGFGKVVQTDTEQFQDWVKTGASNITAQDLHQDPVKTNSWSHTGAFTGRASMLNQFAHEYWYEEMSRNGYSVTQHERMLPEAQVTLAPNLDASILQYLSPEEWRQAARACKGMALRTEVFALDAPLSGATNDQLQKQLTPYTVSTHNCNIELLQPKGQNPYAVFIVKESEGVTYNYEQDTSDPRILHKLSLSFDEYGNVLDSASVVYPRILTDSTLPFDIQQLQQQSLLTYLANQYTNDMITATDYRLRMPSEAATYEIKGLSKTGFYYQPADFDQVLNTATEVAYQQIDAAPAPGTTQKRLIEQIRTIYRSNNLTTALTLHTLDSKGFSYENYQLAYTPALVTDLFGTRVDAALMLEGKFCHSEGDANWWIRSGTSDYITGTETLPAAQSRFYMPVSFTDPYGATTKVKYDSNYILFIQEIEDAIGNKASIDQFNYRTLSPGKLKDINDNLSEVLSDELGFVKAVALYGKGTEADDLTGLHAFTTTAENTLKANFFNSADSVQLVQNGKDLLQHATTCYVLDFHSYVTKGKPAVIASISREEHFQKNNHSPVQLSFEYTNGLGQVMLKKTQAEPGLARQVVVQPDDSYTVTTIDTSSLTPPQLRWIGNGRTVLNNKGNAVQQYEPYFSVSFQYEDLKELIETGVTSTLYYDAPGRIIKTVLPDESYSKVEYTSWKQLSWDQNDTLLDSPWYLNRHNGLINAELIADGKDPALEKQVADQAVKHANTPAVQHFDTMGRPVLAIAHNKDLSTAADVFSQTRAILDAEGNQRGVIDSRDNLLMQYKYNMLGNLVYQDSTDAGKRWLIQDITGKPLRTWDERNHEFQYYYDIMHRSDYSKILGGDGAVALDNIFERFFYGDTVLNAKVKNLKGQIIKRYDTGGLIDTPAYDFKGKPVSTNRTLFKYYKQVANWIDGNLVSNLETDSYTFTTELDALGRISKQTAPDGSVITPAYNEAGLLNSETVAHTDPVITTTYIKDIDYNEKGQRSKIIYGNDVITRFYYDRETFRLNRLESKRQNNDPLQDWTYSYDPVGNVAFIKDQNIPVVFFNNQKVTGMSEYIYDALYQLVNAKGRENDAALVYTNKDNWNDIAFMQTANPGDPMAVRNYTQSYQYDKVGNIQQVQHVATGNSWTRTYQYGTGNNRLNSTKIGASTYAYTHHPEHGFILGMPHLEEMGWSFKEELIKTVRQKRLDGGTAETTYYQYDGQGQRVRKITENEADPGNTPTVKEERIYNSGYELYRKVTGTNAGLERRSLSLIDQGNRFVMAESRNAIDDGTEKHLVRYQLHNHTGSASMELDATAQLISYEEYHPFGTTAYQAKNATVKAAAKRYRYTGMERDEESGLSYHSSRYELPWLGRWLNVDAAGLKDGVNLYAYTRNNPIRYNDQTGTQSDPVQINFWESRVYHTEVTATYSARGISPELRATMTGVYRIWTSDYTSEVDVGHMGKPFVLLRAGERSPVGPQLAGPNRSDGGGAVRAMAAAVRGAGGFTRTDDLDLTPAGIASKGTRYPAIALPPALRDPRLPVIGRLTAAPPTPPPLITVPPASGTGAPVTPVTPPAPMEQLSFDFNAPPRPAAPPRPPVAPPRPVTPPRAATPPRAPSGGGGGRSGRSVPMGGGGVGTSVVGAVGRAVPFVAEAEVVLTGAAGASLMTATTAPLAAPLLATAEALPVVAGVAVIGAGTGHIVRAVASEAGASRSTADGLGLGAAVLTGAAIGSVIPGVGTAVGAGVGALVAGGLYLWSL